MFEVREKDKNYCRSNYSVPATLINASSTVSSQQPKVTSLPGLPGCDSTGLLLKDPHGNPLRRRFAYHAHFAH